MTTDKLGHDIEEAIQHHDHPQETGITTILLRWWDALMDGVGLTHSDTPVRTTVPIRVHPAYDFNLSGSDPHNRRVSLLSMIEHLDPPLDEALFDELLDIQTEMWTAQDELITRFEQQEVTPVAYLDEFNALMKLDMAKCLALLGDERFDAIFGEAGRDPSGLIDREIFLGQFDSTWGIRG